MRNAGDYNRRIIIVRRTPSDDGEGFKSNSEVEVCKAWAKIKTTKGYTLVSQGSNFEDATTLMEIRKPSVEISRKDIVLFKGREWRIRYLNDINEAGRFVELQVEEIRQNG
jgi:SPP1 family predicted phage head-tail adaptor